jgi:4-hydroxythreonine-4-phosphate dehydrogenase
MNRKPRIAMLLGDPAGIGPELIANLLAEAATTEAADVLLIADRAEFDEGLRIAGVQVDVAPITSLDKLDFSAGKPLFYDYRGDTEGSFERAVATVKGGRYCLDTLAMALDAVKRGVADAIVFAPLNKHSLHEAGMRTSDELHWFVDQLGFTGPVSEFNVQDGLWTSRETSHIAHREVADQITPQGVTQGIELIHLELLLRGVANPGAMLSAFQLACRMAVASRAQSNHALPETAP